MRQIRQFPIRWHCIARFDITEENFGRRLYHQPEDECAWSYRYDHEGD